MIALLTSKLGRYVAGAVALLLAIMTFGSSERRKGAKKAKEKMNEQDRKRADAIRADARDSVRDDKSGYRD